METLRPDVKYFNNTTNCIVTSSVWQWWADNVLWLLIKIFKITNHYFSGGVFQMWSEKRWTLEVCVCVCDGKNSSGSHHWWWSSGTWFGYLDLWDRDSLETWMARIMGSLPWLLIRRQQRKLLLHHPSPSGFLKDSEWRFQDFLFVMFVVFSSHHISGDHL